MQPQNAQKQTADVAKSLAVGEKLTFIIVCKTYGHKHICMWSVKIADLKGDNKQMPSPPKKKRK